MIEKLKKFFKNRVIIILLTFISTAVLSPIVYNYMYPDEIKFIRLQTEELENKKNVPNLNSAIDNKIAEVQENGKNIIKIDGEKSTNVISINYGKKQEPIKFIISLKNDSFFVYGGDSSGKEVNINIKNQMFIIDGTDIRNNIYTKKVEFKIEKGGGTTPIIEFSLDKIFKDNDLRYPSNIELYLTYNDNKVLPNTDYEIVLLKSDISLINSSGINNVLNNYYNKFKDTKLGLFGVQRVNNRNEKDLIYGNRDKFTKNEIWYTEDRYKNLANYLNRELFSNAFLIRKVTIDDCYNFIIDNRIELLTIQVGEAKYDKVGYLFDGGILPSDDSLCKVSNLMFNIVN